MITEFYATNNAGGPGPWVQISTNVNITMDATADYSGEMMHAALDVNMPNYASAIVTTDEIVDAISSLQRSGLGAQTVAIGHS